MKEKAVVEMQIGDLISAIKKDGVEAAQAEAERIVADAKAQAAKIVADAREEAEQVRKKAERETEILKESARVAAEHAKRDAMLSFKNSVRAEFEKLLAADVSESLAPAALAKLICAALGGEDASQYVAEVREITDALKGELAEKLRGGLEIRANPNVKTGFRLAAKDGSGYFDCSDEAIAQMLLPYFSDLTV